MGLLPRRKFGLVIHMNGDPHPWRLTVPGSPKMTPEGRLCNRLNAGELLGPTSTALSSPFHDHWLAIEPSELREGV